jgi:hypothetical protein
MATGGAVCLRQWRLICLPFLAENRVVFDAAAPAGKAAPGNSAGCGRQ